MIQWFFSSKGRPVAFRKDKLVYTYQGFLMGVIRLRRMEVWLGSYVGEVLNENRILYKKSKPRRVRGIARRAGRVGVPSKPVPIGAIGMPGGYRDISLKE